MKEFIKCLVFVACLIVVLIFLTADNTGCHRSINRVVKSHNQKDDDDSSGLMITPQGNLGIEIAPGIGIDLGSGQLSPGFGF